jgi:hypothetical protein
MLCILTLGDIVKKFDLAGFYSLLGRLHMAQNSFAKTRHLPAQDLDSSHYAHFSEICEHAARYCNSVGFNHSSKKAFTLMSYLRTLPGEFNASALEAEFRNIETDITIEMFKHQFVQIEESGVQHLSLSQKFGKVVIDAFPSAATDITDAGNCLALEFGTATVFHSMRVVECGIRAFAVHLGLGKIAVNRKNGKTIPIAYAQWEQILNQLPDKIEAKILRIARGPKRQNAQQFYYSTLQELGGFKEAWRNHVMHARVAYTPIDAQAVLSHVERFMKSLAEHGIHESQKRK